MPGKNNFEQRPQPPGGGEGLGPKYEIAVWGQEALEDFKRSIPELFEQYPSLGVVLRTHVKSILGTTDMRNFAEFVSTYDEQKGVNRKDIEPERSRVEMRIALSKYTQYRLGEVVPQPSEEEEWASFLKAFDTLAAEEI